MTKPESSSPNPRTKPQRFKQIDAPDFNLELTLDCGQVFHWTRQGAGWLGLIGATPVFIEQRGPRLFFKGGAEPLIRHYFALDHPLAKIRASFPDDPAMAAAADFCRGLRIVRQPIWECLASFITSSLKQVAHIRQMSHALRARFGERIEFEGTELFSYPTPERIAAADESELRECKLGYRAKNLHLTAQAIARGDPDLQKIAALDDVAALAELCRLHGVGEKVANCVLLFAYGRLRAFPIDVWIERVLRETYFARKRKVTAARLRLFSQTYFGAYGGYAQQYLFHYARVSRRPTGRDSASVQAFSTPP